MMVWSSLPEANVLPSGLNATLSTLSVWPVRVAGAGGATSQRMMVWSSYPKARVLPLGLNATLFTARCGR